MELFKLMKPRMFGREIRESLFKDGVRDGSLPALSTVDQAPHKKQINTRENRGYIRRYLLFPQILNFQI